MARQKLLTIQPVQVEEIAPSDPGEATWGINEVMAYLGVSRPYIYKLIRLEKLPHDLIAHRYVFYPSLVREWKARRQRVL